MADDDDDAQIDDDMYSWLNQLNQNEEQQMGENPNFLMLQQLMGQQSNIPDSTYELLQMIRNRYTDSSQISSPILPGIQSSNVIQQPVINSVIPQNLVMNQIPGMTQFQVPILSESSAQRPVERKDIKKTASDARKRKKNEFDELLIRMRNLEEENSRLKDQMLDAERQTHRIKIQYDGMLSNLTDASANGDIKKCMEPFHKLYYEYSKNRGTEAAFNLEHVKDKLTPTNPTKLSLWSFIHDNSKNKQDSLFEIISREIDISPDQIEKVMHQKDRLRSLGNGLKECFSIIHDLKSKVDTRLKQYNSRMRSLLSTLDHHQQARFLIWVEEHDDELKEIVEGFGWIDNDDDDEAANARKQRRLDNE